jgi:hypothetical protein
LIDFISAANSLIVFSFFASILSVDYD